MDSSSKYLLVTIHRNGKYETITLTGSIVTFLLIESKLGRTDTAIIRTEEISQDDYHRMY